VVLASLAALRLFQPPESFRLTTFAEATVAKKAEATSEPAGWADVVQGYRAALGRAGIVGSSLMIVRDGRIVARANEGRQDREAGAPVTDDTIYHWASITKTFTGIAIMQLRDRGLLSLDDPVVKFVPELRLAHDPFGDISQVKIRHLMSHSAGFRASTWPWGGDKPWHPFEPTSWEQIVAMMPYTDVQFAPGSKYSYSNPGVIFLGRIIQLLSGDDYEVYVTKNILMPHSAGFRASTWRWGGDKPWHPFEPTSWEQIVAMMPYTDVQFAPGSKYSYSNPGVIFLGRIIQLLSGDDYEVYVTKNILMPLGMQRTFFDRAPYFLRPFRSHSYVRDEAGLREAPFDFDTGITVSNGGLNAPFGDMARYLAFLSGSGDSAGLATYNTVLKRASLEEMWTPQIRASEGEGVNGTDSQAALSFFVEQWPLDSRRSLGTGPVELVGHSGDQNGFISHLYLHRPSRTAWVISLNTDTTASKDGSRPSSRQVDMIVRDLIVSKMLH